MAFWNENVRIAFTLPQLQELCAAGGFEGKDIEIAAAIAMGESSGRLHAIGDHHLIDEKENKWGPSVGLFQIRTLKYPDRYPYPDTRRDLTKLFDPEYNVKTALEFKEIFGWESVWTVYRTGKYKEFLRPDRDRSIKVDVNLNTDLKHTKPTGPDVPKPPKTVDLPETDEPDEGNENGGT